MPTVSDLVEETRALLYSTAHTEQNKLAVTVDSSTDSFQFSYSLRGIVPGVRVSVEEEVVYVWAVDKGTNTATVQRGYQGTTAASHTSGAMVDINPPFPLHRIKSELKKEINSWPADVFAVDTTTVTVSDSYRTQGVDSGISGEWWHILDVRSSPLDHRTYSSSVWSSVPHYEVQRNAPVADFASGTALILHGGFNTGSVVVTYSKPFDTSTWDDGTDLESDVGLMDSMLDIPVMGAAWRLASVREVKRTLDEAQGESRYAEEVPPGSSTRAGEYFRAVRNARLGEETARLMSIYPRRHS